jgi:hypothetical protein
MELQRVCLVMLVVNLAVATLHPMWTLWLGERMKRLCRKREEEEEEEKEDSIKRDDGHDEVDHQQRDEDPQQERIELQPMGSRAASV